MAKNSIQILVDWESIKDYMAKSDIVEIVRCKHCKNWDKSWQTIEGCHYCGMIDKQTEGNFFCGDGEREEE